MSLILESQFSVDKITLIIYPNCSFRELRSNAEALLNDFCAVRGLHRNLVCYKESGYAYSMTLPLSENLNYPTKNNNDGKPKIFVQVCNTSGQKQRIRVDISGYPLSRADYFMTKMWLMKLTGNDLACLAFDQMRVTRLDIAMDLEKPIDELYFNVSRFNKEMLFLSDKGKLESRTIGPTNRDLKICIYDLDAKAASKGVNGARRKKRNGKYKTRVELRINPKCKLSELQDKVNLNKYFNRVEIFDPRFLEVTEMSQVLKNHFAYFGYQATFKALDPEQQAELKKLIKEFKHSYLDLDDQLEQLQEEFLCFKGLDPTIDYTKRSQKAQKTALKYENRFRSYNGQSLDQKANYICS